MIQHSKQSRPAVADIATDVGARFAPVGRHGATSRSALRDSAFFLRGFLHHPEQVGSVIPSSRFLERRIVQCANAHAARIVVELGPGTGGTTRALLNSMRADARLLAIDLSRAFCGRLATTIQDARLAIQCGSAEHVEAFMQGLRLPHADAIVSGIPFSTMPPAVADRIARAVATALAPGGHFVAYQVRPHVADYMAPYLGTSRCEWELINVPPMRVFTWVRAE
jgi:phospholipid N-methyltransferase